MGEPITIQTVHEKLVNLHDGLEERYRQEAERYSKLDAKFDVVFQSAKESAWTPVIVLAAFVIAGAIGYHLRGLGRLDYGHLFRHLWNRKRHQCC